MSMCGSKFRICNNEDTEMITFCFMFHTASKLFLIRVLYLTDRHESETEPLISLSSQKENKLLSHHVQLLL